MNAFEKLKAWSQENSNHLIFICLPSKVEQVLDFSIQSGILKFNTASGNIYTGDNFQLVLGIKAPQQKISNKNKHHLISFLTKEKNSLIFQKAFGFIDYTEGYFYQSNNLKKWVRFDSRLTNHTIEFFTYQCQLNFSPNYVPDEIFNRTVSQGGQELLSRAYGPVTA